MLFRWNSWNHVHIAKHGVTPEEAEGVVESAKRPFPMRREDGKWLVMGRGTGGRWLQVIFVLDEDEHVFLIHARPLTGRERARYRSWLKP